MLESVQLFEQVGPEGRFAGRRLGLFDMGSRLFYCICGRRQKVQHEVLGWPVSCTWKGVASSLLARFDWRGM
jgi:hypothetical protein